MPESLNRAPVLTMPPAQIIDEQTAWTLPLAAAAQDGPANALTYSLISAPDGVSLDATNGVLSWTPTEAQGPSTNLITVQVTGAGPPALSATGIVRLIVDRTEEPVRLTTPVRDFTVTAGTTLVFTNSATGSNTTTDTLVYIASTPSPGCLLLALDGATGQTKWEFTIGGRWSYSSPTPGAGSKIRSYRPRFQAFGGKMAGGKIKPWNLFSALHMAPLIYLRRGFRFFAGGHPATGLGRISPAASPPFTIPAFPSPSL